MVEDFGSHNAPKCKVCDTNRDRRYAFFIRCEDGVEHGPVGTGCVFRHVLGESSGKKFSVKLQKITEDQGHLAEHARMIKESKDYVAYLERIGVGWIMDGVEYRRLKLTGAQFRELAVRRSGCLPIPKNLLAALLKHQVLSASPEIPKPAPRKLAAPAPAVEPPAPLPKVPTSPVVPAPSKMAGIRRDVVAQPLKAGKSTKKPKAQKPVNVPREVSKPELVTAVCRLLNDAGRSDVRVALMQKPMDWLAKSMPGECTHFSVHGGFPRGFIKDLAARLRT